MARKSKPKYEYSSEEEEEQMHDVVEEEDEEELEAIAKPFDYDDVMNRWMMMKMRFVFLV